MTALPTEAQLTALNLSRKNFRQSMKSVRNYLSGLLGTDGEGSTVLDNLDFRLNIVEAVAVGTLGSHKAISVVNGYAYYTDINNVTSVDNYVGISIISVGNGDTIRILTYGVLVDSSFVGQLNFGDLYVSSTSTITNTIPSAGAILNIGTYIKPSTILLIKPITVF